jgi:UDP-N-acetylmuramate--alanine ligase
MQLHHIHTIYFLGIGGIGMSALARFFRKHGAEVYGYDRTETALTRALVAEGMQVHYTDDPAQIPANLDLAVWTPAVPADLQELQFLKHQNVPLKKRAEVLGIISRGKRCAAIAGTHGKTSTSSLTAHLLRSGGIDATAFLGGIALNLGSNFVEGDSDWVVAEADEYDRSFLHLHPDIAVLNSMDPDHLDIYGTPEAVEEAYRQFVRQIKPGGVLLHKYGLPLESVRAELRADGRRAFHFGIDAGDLYATDIRVENGRLCFLLHTGPDWTSTPLSGLEIALAFPGRHNVENAAAAAGVALLAGISPLDVQAGLRAYRGVHRRFEYIIREEELVFVDDYAHHPAELSTTIDAARMFFPGREITGVFQPHLYTRTRDFAAEFAAALDKLDRCYLLPIYPARELPIEGVQSEMLAALMKKDNAQVLGKTELMDTLAQQKPELLLTMGAGDIDTLVQPIKNILLKTA